MTNAGFSLFLDGAILVLLMATVFFAARLSLHLKDFRESRHEFDRLINKLTVDITKAEQSIAGLREAARESGRDLQDTIKQARALADELQFMGESGNTVATRLEKAVTGGRSAARGGAASFAIRDPEFEPEITEDAREDGLFPGEESGHGGSGQFSSRAERELFEALRGSRKKTGAGGVS